MHVQANCFLMLKLCVSHQEDLGAVEGRTSERSETESDQESVRRTMMVTAKITLVAQRTRQTMMAGPRSAAEQQPHLIWLQSNSSLPVTTATNWLKDSS